MEKITKVQEVSSFIVNFDNKHWNEVVLQLTIIGIRYITNYCNNYFKWRMEDLLTISEQLNTNKILFSNSFKTLVDNNSNKNNKYNNISNYHRNDNNIYNYNYNYSNSPILQKK